MSSTYLLWQYLMELRMANLPTKPALADAWEKHSVRDPHPPAVWNHGPDHYAFDECVELQTLGHWPPEPNASVGVTGKPWPAKKN
jgi:hypothetical protein